MKYMVYNDTYNSGLLKEKEAKKLCMSNQMINLRVIVYDKGKIVAREKPETIWDLKPQP